MEAKNASTIKFFDYGKSFVITENNKKNTPRFLIESKCTIDNEEYYLCAPCKGESTYAEESLFSSPPFEFTPIIHKEELLFFRRFNFFNDSEKNEYKKAYIGEDIWGNKKVSIREVIAKELLDSHKKIFEAVRKGKPIMCRIIIKKNGKTATIDFPIKTINVNNNEWQVDTGVLAVPDLTMKSPYQIFTFNLGYVAFNNFKWVEFITRDFQKIGEYLIVVPYTIFKIKDLKIYLYSL